MWCYALMCDIVEYQRPNLRTTTLKRDSKKVVLESIDDNVSLLYNQNCHNCL